MATDPVILKRSIYLLCVPLFLVFAVLACAGTALLDVPVYTCPTAVPPTAMPTVLPGTATPIPPPPQPTSTPYVILPPADFYVGDAIFVGGTDSPARVRFRLSHITGHLAPMDGMGQPQQVVGWRLEVRNVGNEVYEVFPAVQMVLSEVMTTNGIVSGIWASSQAAADVAGISIDDNIYTLATNETRSFRFAAFAPAGDAQRFTFTLDPTVTVGSGVISWINQTNPHCAGDVADQ